MLTGSIHKIRNPITLNLSRFAATTLGQRVRRVIRLYLAIGYPVTDWEVRVGD